MQSLDHGLAPRLAREENACKPKGRQVVVLLRLPNGKPEAGKYWWMAFSNSVRVLGRGDRVDVVIGQVRALG